jgi:hypothetical protein
MTPSPAETAAALSPEQARLLLQLRAGMTVYVHEDSSIYRAKIVADLAILGIVAGEPVHKQSTGPSRDIVRIFLTLRGRAVASAIANTLNGVARE